MEGSREAWFARREGSRRVSRLSLLLPALNLNATMMKVWRRIKDVHHEPITHHPSAGRQTLAARRVGARGDVSLHIPKTQCLAQRTRRQKNHPCDSAPQRQRQLWRRGLLVWWRGDGRETYISSNQKSGDIWCEFSGQVGRTVPIRGAFGKSGGSTGRV